MAINGVDGTLSLLQETELLLNLGGVGRVMIPKDGEEKRHIRLVPLVCLFLCYFLPTLYEIIRSLEVWSFGFLMLLLRPL